MSPSASVVVLIYLVVVVLVVEAAVVPPPETKIVGGHEIEIADAPWQASVLIGETIFCGGSILNDRWVLTAAECVVVFPTEIIKIRIGSKKLLDGGKVYEVFKVVVHGKFNQVGRYNDICLIKTMTPMDLISPVKPVRLPGLGEKRPAVGTSLTVTGFGLTEDGMYAHTLREVNVEIVDFEKCAQFAQSNNETSICAGLPGKNSCEGDAGSPLVMGDLLVGVFSHDNPNATCGDSPSLYMDVAYYRDWIDLHTNPPDCQQPL